jgi:hypothetical protein
MANVPGLLTAPVENGMADYEANKDKLGMSPIASAGLAIAKNTPGVHGLWAVAEGGVGQGLYGVTDGMMFDPSARFRMGGFGLSEASGVVTLVSKVGLILHSGRIATAVEGRAAVSTVVPVETVPNVGGYGVLTDELKGTGIQSNHLNQNGAYGEIIPKQEGISVGMRGNAITDVGSPHYDFHSNLEDFWNPYRRGGEFFLQRPTNAQYGAALQDALIRAGYTPAEAAFLGRLAAGQRAARGLAPGALAAR